MTTLEIDWLRALVAVADSGSFTAAGERLARTQSAVSVQIAKLEEACERRLLDRGRRGAEPTAEGARLIGYARRMLALHDEAVAALSGTEEGVVGRVRLGVPDDYVGTFLPPLVAAFAHKHPKVQLEVRCALSRELEPALALGDLDLAIVTLGAESLPGSEVLRREPLNWTAAPGFRPERADPLPLALFPEGCRFRPLIFAALHTAGRRWRVSYSSASLAGLQAAAATGLAVTVLAASTVPAGWRLLGPAEGLPVLPPVDIGLRLGSSLSPPARRLADHLRATVGAIPARAA